MPRSKSEYVKLNLGSILIPRTTWDRAVRICGYNRADIRATIVQNGEESLASSIDSQDFCSHGEPASAGICCACEREQEEEALNGTK